VHLYGKYANDKKCIEFNQYYSTNRTRVHSVVDELQERIKLVYECVSIDTSCNGGLHHCTVDQCEVKEH